MNKVALPTRCFEISTTRPTETGAVVAKGGHPRQAGRKRPPEWRLPRFAARRLKNRPGTSHGNRKRQSRLARRCNLGVEVAVVVLTWMGASSKNFNSMGMGRGRTSYFAGLTDRVTDLGRSNRHRLFNSGWWVPIIARIACPATRSAGGFTRNAGLNCYAAC
jgi:hypothetical protein